MTSSEIAERTGAALRTVNEWAAKNKVEYVGEGRRKTYVWTEADLERFKEREGPGRRWR